MSRLLKILRIDTALNYRKKTCRRKRKRHIDEREKLLNINKLAADFFRRELLKDGESGKAREYLKKRGVSKQIVDDFQLGFCSGWMGQRRQVFQRKKKPRCVL